jgi:environmental stress-induced protein Ves
MTIQTFTQKDFSEMPWKNGGGVTTELFRLNDPESSAFLFRLSMASVLSDGPFSSFPGIDRILLLLKGRGFHLKGPTLETSLIERTPPLYFKGEDPINCTLIDGPCIDFNVMTARYYAKSTISVENVSENNPIILRAECNFRFIYDKEAQELYKLNLGDELVIEGKTRPLIIIDVTTL